MVHELVRYMKSVNMHGEKIKGLLIIPVSSTCFGKLFCPSSGALDCVFQLVVQRTHDVADRYTGRQHRGCIIPQAVTHSLVLL